MSSPPPAFPPQRPASPSSGSAPRFGTAAAPGNPPTFAPQPSYPPPGGYVTQPSAPTYAPGYSSQPAQNPPAGYSAQPAYSTQPGYAARSDYRTPGASASPASGQRKDRSPHLVDLAYGRRRKRGPKIVRRIFAGLLAALLVVAGIMAFDIFRARAALMRMVMTANSVDLSLLNNQAEADRLLSEFQQDSATAANSLSGPLWNAATHLPFIGDDIEAVQVITGTFSDLAVSGLPELLDVAITTRNMNLSNVDLNAITSSLAQVQTSDAALSDGITRLQGIDQSGLIPELSELSTNLILQLQELRQITGPIAAASELAANAAQLFPGLFG